MEKNDNFFNPYCIQFPGYLESPVNINEAEGQVLYV